jgi:GNAT superfamily N-acetyltransferase
VGTRGASRDGSRRRLVTTRIARLSPDTWPDFRRIHCDENDTGWCFCVAWWVETWDVFKARSAEENLAQREELCRGGHNDGYLLYVDHEPVGWCQVGARDRLAKLARQYSLEPDPRAWALTCFQIVPGRRRQGLAAELLTQVLSALQAEGVEVVEAFPKRGEGLEAHDLWTGPESLFLQLGFEVWRDDPSRPILRRSLERRRGA